MIKKNRLSLRDTFKSHESYWKFDKHIKLLDDCKECDKHDGIDKTFVKCGRVKDYTTLVNIMPSCYFIGFKNTDTIVYCKKD